ncbi:MAG: acetyl-CoA carboxylase biotin carboxyl carrier protein subunit [Candidatus Kapaibacteriota bacterium]
MFINIDGYSYEIEVQDETFLLLRTFAQNEETKLGATVKLKAPMPGLVVKVLVSEGDSIAKGQKAVILEAMKMENALASPANGSISKVFVREGQTVEKDATLVEIVVR